MNVKSSFGRTDLAKYETEQVAPPKKIMNASDRKLPFELPRFKSPPPEMTKAAFAAPPFCYVGVKVRVNRLILSIETFISNKLTALF